MRWLIPYNVPSSKNSKQIVINKGRYRVVHSDLVYKYIENTAWYYKAYGREFKKYVSVQKLEPPYKVKMQFIRGSKHKFDYINAAQIVQDLMVKYKWIPDDNCEFLLPEFLPYIYDKGKPGVIISI